MPQYNIATIAEIARVHAVKRPDAVALMVGERTITFAQLGARSSRAAQAFRAAGVSYKAVVVPAAGISPSEAELIAYARHRLGGFKLPKSVDFAERLPRTPSGKLLKRTLREPYWKGVGRRIG